WACRSRATSWSRSRAWPCATGSSASGAPRERAPVLALRAARPLPRRGLPDRGPLPRVVLRAEGALAGRRSRHARPRAAPRARVRLAGRAGVLRHQRLLHQRGLRVAVQRRALGRALLLAALPPHLPALLGHARLPGPSLGRAGRARPDLAARRPGEPDAPARRHRRALAQQPHAHRVLAAAPGRRRAALLPRALVDAVLRGAVLRHLR